MNQIIRLQSGPLATIIAIALALAIAIALALTIAIAPAVIAIAIAIAIAAIAIAHELSFFLPSQSIHQRTNFVDF